MVAQAWGARQLIPPLGIRVTIKGFAGTKLGRSWLLLRPTITLFGMALLFGAVLSTPSSGLPYMLFLLLSMHAWIAFDRTLFWGTRSFDVYRRVIRSFNFPRLLVPVAAIMPAFVEFCVIGLLMTATLIYFSVADGMLYLEIGPGLGVAVAGYLLACAIGLAFALWTSPLNARARDVRIVMIFVLQIWLYVTPVVYPTSALPDGFKWIATVNPLVAPVEMVRSGLVGVGSVDIAALAVSLGTLIVVGGAGVWFFTRQATSLMRVAVVEDENEEEEEFR